MELCEQLKLVPSGWRQLFALFTRTPRPYFIVMGRRCKWYNRLAEVQFFCVQLFEEFAQNEK